MKKVSEWVTGVLSTHSPPFHLSLSRLHHLHRCTFSTSPPLLLPPSAPLQTTQTTTTTTAATTSLSSRNDTPYQFNRPLRHRQPIMLSFLLPATLASLAGRVFDPCPVARCPLVVLTPALATAAQSKSVTVCNANQCLKGKTNITNCVHYSLRSGSRR